MRIDKYKLALKRMCDYMNRGGKYKSSLYAYLKVSSYIARHKEDSSKNYYVCNRKCDKCFIDRHCPRWYSGIDSLVISLIVNEEHMEGDVFKEVYNELLIQNIDKKEVHRIRRR